MGGLKGGLDLVSHRTRHKLSAAFVKSAPAGKYNDGGGLWLHVVNEARAKWFYRFTLHGKRREMGLGTHADVSLQGAREAADTARSLVKEGIDPILQREKERRDAIRHDNTLRKIAEEAFEARKAELRDDGKAGRWFSPLELHVLPKLGSFPVSSIDQRLIRDTLRPIWHEKAVTARKAMNRLGLVLQHAAALGLDVDIQATGKAKALLGKQRHRTQHIEAMPWQEVPAFYASLPEPTIANLAMKLLILTGHRVKPVRFLRLEHIGGNIWTAPPELLKGRRLRRALWMAGLVAIRQRENSFRDKYTRYIARDPDNADLKRKALTAVTAKMARTAHAVIKSGKAYRPFYEGPVPGGRTSL